MMDTGAENTSGSTGIEGTVAMNDPVAASVGTLADLGYALFAVQLRGGAEVITTQRAVGWDLPMMHPDVETVEVDSTAGTDEPVTGENFPDHLSDLTDEDTVEELPTGVVDEQVSDTADDTPTAVEETDTVVDTSSEVGSGSFIGLQDPSVGVTPLNPYAATSPYAAPEPVTTPPAAVPAPTQVAPPAPEPELFPNTFSVPAAAPLGQMWVPEPLDSDAPASAWTAETDEQDNTVEEHPAQRSTVEMLRDLSFLD